jgi:hypothetical protein
MTRGRRRLGGTFAPGDLAMVSATIAPDWASSLETVAPNVTTLVEENRNTGENWYDALARLLPVLASTYQQKQLLQVQVDRAKQGLPPLDASQYAGGVQVGMAPELQKMLMWGGIAALGIFAFMATQRR